MKMIKQRLMGVALIALTGVLLAVASTGETMEDRDATFAFFTFPLGLYMLVIKDYILNDAGDTGDELELEKARECPDTGHKRKEPQHGKEAYYRSPVPQVLGGRQRRPTGNRPGANCPRGY